MFKILIIVTAAVALLSCATTSQSCDLEEVKRHFQYEVYIEGPLSIQEIEKKELKWTSTEKKVQLPFGNRHEYWLRFIENFSKGDCIFYFKSGEESWKGLYGREGYVIVRNNVPVEVFLVKVS